MFEAVDTIIDARIKNQWSQTDIDYDNVEYKPTRGTAFIRLQTEWVDTNIISVGGRSRGTGYLNVSVFVPSNTGTSTISTMCDDIATIFNKYESGNLKFKVARQVRVGEREQWYRRDVIIPFDYDDC